MLQDQDEKNVAGQWFFHSTKCVFKNELDMDGCVVRSWNKKGHKGFRSEADSLSSPVSTVTGLSATITVTQCLSVSGVCDRVDI